MGSSSRGLLCIQVPDHGYYITMVTIVTMVTMATMVVMMYPRLQKYEGTQYCAEHAALHDVTVSDRAHHNKPTLIPCPLGKRCLDGI